MKLALVLLFPLLAQAYDGIRIQPGTTVRFATAEEGAAILLQKDDYYERLSRFDVQSRLLMGEERSRDDLVKFQSKQVIEWSPKGKERIEKAVAAVLPGLMELHLPLPKEILLVNTNGNEEGGAAYTRSNGIFFPALRIAKNSDEALQSLFVHELFHVLSRNDVRLRDDLYSTIGFRAINEVQLPGTMESRRLTNPDAPKWDSYIHLGQEGDFVPTLYSEKDYDPAQGGPFFKFITFRLMEIEKKSDGLWGPKVNARFLEAKKIPSFWEQIGKNTNYIIHPEEILADNFSLLVRGKKDLLSPQVVEAMRQRLRK